MKHMVAVLVLLGAVAVAASDGAGADQKEGGRAVPHAAERHRIDDAIDRAMQWLRAHPAELGGHGALEVAEEVMFYYLLRALTSTPSDLERYRKEIAARHAVIQPFNETLIENGYHLQGIWGPLTYLPLTHIIAGLGMDAASYRAIVDDIVANHRFLYPARDAMQFWIAVYMERLGYRPATPVATLLERSKLSRNLQSEDFLNRLQFDHADERQATMQLVYDITHEVFALTDFGALPAPAEWASLRDYHRLLFEHGIRWAIRVSAIDILAELVVAAHLLELPAVASMPAAIATILGAQQSDGTFGVTNPNRPDGRRHGVLTCLLALNTYLALGHRW